jgi:hypothetical protein
MRKSLGNSQASGLAGMRWWATFSLLCICCTLRLSAQTPEAWKAAAHTIRRLPPDSFPQLPVAIRAALAARGCSVPQSFTSERPHNVIAGRFAHAGRQDWAVLCSHHDSSSILIFWASADAPPPTELARAFDASSMQAIGRSRSGYSRMLAVASPAQIRDYAAAFGGPLPKVLDHDGVEDAFAGKASTVSYLEEGRWLALSGAD